jgi:hypothetical protein
VSGRFSHVLACPHPVFIVGLEANLTPGGAELKFSTPSNPSNDTLAVYFIECAPEKSLMFILLEDRREKPGKIVATHSLHIRYRNHGLGTF